MKSMTGFGKGTFVGADFTVSVEIRTVNNRFLDTHIRLPQELTKHEQRVKKQIQQSLKRGRADVTVSFQQTEEVRFELNLPLVRGYVAALQRAREATGVDGMLDLSLIARLPGAVQQPPADEGRDETVAAGLSAAVAQALEGLDATRTAEGSELAAELGRRLETIAAQADEIEAGAAEVVDLYRRKLERRMADLLRDVGDLDPVRLAQEAAYFAERSDIAEEITRLKSHVVQFRGLLTQPGEVGKTMDFLTQELNREANTVLSKSGDLRISQIALAVKVEVEKIKEQVQNVE